MRIAICTFLVVMSLSTASQVHAVMYKVEFTGDNGLEGSGTFDYEDVGQTYSNINISVEGSYTETYDTLGPSDDATNFAPRTATDVSVGWSTLNLYFAGTGLDGLPETASIENLILIRCEHLTDLGTCRFPYNVIESKGTGTVTKLSDVPIPAAAWLFGSGLIGLVGAARRKQSRA